MPISHYIWAGLDFMLDEDYRPVLLDANRSSHMLWEYLKFHQDERPFQLTAAAMNRGDGPACVLWRRNDLPFDGGMLGPGGERASFIAHYLAKHLRRAPLICHVEDNQEERRVITTASGETVVPGSLFRWWYQAPWSYERGGTVVVNPNCLWVTVRDKHHCYETLKGAQTFRVPQTFPIGGADDIPGLLERHQPLFSRGYVLKPRVGWGGHGVHVVAPGEPAEPFSPTGPYLLSERIVPPPRPSRRYWDVRVFVMNGEYCGGVVYASDGPVTNFHQGGVSEPLPAELSARLEEPAVEAVSLLDAAAESVPLLSLPSRSDLVTVVY